MGDRNKNVLDQDKKSGCGLITAVFCRNKTKKSSPIETPVDQSKRRHHVAFSQPPPPKPANLPNHPPPSNPTGKTTNNKPYEVYVSQGRRVPKEAVGISGELESMLVDHHHGRGNLVRASSSNVMLFGNLGNLKTTNNPSPVPFSGKAQAVAQARSYGSGGGAAVSSLCRAVSTRMDPETLKAMGNEDYKNGRFAEALALYDAAISIDPDKASYRSNKSAALSALGRLLEAVLECREAIRIDPRYHRAHLRLATLYLRLGEAEKARYHYQHAGQEADRDDLAKVKLVQSHLLNCTEARRSRDWNTLVKETNLAISSGADSAPQIYALQAEALLRLHRHQEADKALSRGPKFDVDSCTKFLGPIGNANLLVTTAQVHMAIGRFEEALEAAGRASRLDPNSREAGVVGRKARGVCGARSKGNELFKAGRFSDACMAYNEGLNHDPYNSVLLCNRAACRSKLGQLEKAVDDCTAALNLRPSYTKARFRRADCNSKLERWEISIMDYEVLLQENPEDEDARRALSEARSRLKQSSDQVQNDGTITTDDDSS